MTNWIPPQCVYEPGKELDLFPDEPCDPHGTGSYVRIPLRSDLPAGHIRAFDTEADYTNTQAKLVKPPIDERDTSFYSPLAEVTEAAADWLVIKAYDYAYYPGSFGAPWENNEEADGRFSREHSAYEYYQSNHRNGYPESMPRFYGGWVINLDAGKDEQGQPKFRYVGLILIEYIEGDSIESMCFRERERDWMGVLEPHTFPMPFLTSNGDLTKIKFDLKTRQLVIKKMLHVIAIGLHMGVNHRGWDPWNVFITMQTNNKDLRELRVVFLDHADTEVFELTRYGAGLGPPILTRLPFPPHPYQRCPIEALESFYGWWPLPPSYPADEEEERKAEKLRLKEFDEWLLSPNVFGPLEEAKDEWDQLKAEGKPWPHPYAKYSITDTLHKMQEEKRARAREKKEESQEGEEGGKYFASTCFWSWHPVSPHSAVRYPASPHSDARHYGWWFPDSNAGYVLQSRRVALHS
ncbi:hypothetical protein CPLU01_04533 [Colletotrichum plurivorum]|uniref:Protein kinase domain-containing protein n=1 Tax=Colletotrichum plurivorum TaxID=2175906 RepID=A0A8H6NJM7_9PEZI|nr:hypothetical protein CPLU01_04533 [Colletotrichum plurivorum]